MSIMRSNSEDFQTCPVCLEHFEENGDHVPRLLPCSHTVCHRCVGLLIKSKKLECPECRRKHKAVDGERSFPQNKYMLVNITREPRAPQVKEKTHRFEECPEHKKELNLFCREEGCQKPICVSCMKQHKKHEVVVVEDEENKSELYQNINVIEEKLEAMMTRILTVKQEVNIKTETFTIEVMKKCDEIIKDAEYNMAEVQTAIDKDACTVAENLALLKSLRENSGNEGQDEEILNKLEIVKCMEENIRGNLSGVRIYRYLELTESQAGREPSFGNVMEKEISVELCEAETDETHDKFISARTPAVTRPTATATVTTTDTTTAVANGTITDASKLNCRGKVLIMCWFYTYICLIRFLL